MDNDLEFTFSTDDVDTIKNCIIDFETRGYSLVEKIEENKKTKLVFRLKTNS